MPNNAAQAADEFFDLQAVLTKRAEKAEFVQFADGGVKVPAPPPPVFRGLLAIRESDFDAPHVLIRATEATDDRPKGWQIDVTSNMAQRAWDTEVGFVGTLKLQAEPGAVAPNAKLGPGRDVDLLPAQPFLKPGATHSWFLPDGVDVNCPRPARSLTQRSTPRFCDFALIKSTTKRSTLVPFRLGRKSVRSPLQRAW